MHLAFNCLMFFTYQASDFNNWEKMRNFIVFIILNGRFSFKLNFIPGWNSTRFIPGLNSLVKRNFFIPGQVSSRDDISSRLHVNALIVRTVYSDIFRYVSGHSAILTHVQTYWAALRHNQAYSCTIETYWAIIRHIQNYVQSLP